MTILLRENINLIGVAGETKSLNPALEAQLVSSNKATYVSPPEIGDSSVPVMARKSRGATTLMAGGEVVGGVITPPLYIDGLITHGRSGFGTPSGLTGYVSKFGAGTYEVTGVTVSGGKGATTLTINSGTVADIGGEWSGVIHHDDGIYRTYTIRNAAGSTCSCYPPLEAAVTSGMLTNVQDALSGQHMTEAGYFALADTIFDYHPAFAIRETYAGKIREVDTSGWDLYNGLAAGNVTYNWGLGMHTSGPNTAQLRARIPKHTKVLCGANTGVTKTWSVGGRRGYIELTVSCSDATHPARVQVFVDGRNAYWKDIFSLERVCVPFTGVGAVEVRITSTGIQTGETRIGATTAWLIPDRTQSHVFPPGARVVWIGDSWESRCASAAIRRINERGAASGVVCTGFGKPGEQATWAIANFASIAAQKPSVVLIEYFVNDFTALGVGGVAEWKNRISQLIDLVHGVGAQPVVLMSASTGSQPQTQGIANWAADLAEGVLDSQFA